jgi:ABC-type glycerol-3-phosphate transport system substrate-binding protein
MAGNFRLVKNKGSILKPLVLKLTPAVFQAKPKAAILKVSILSGGCIMKRTREILALGLALTVMVMGSCSKPAASQGGSSEPQPITLKFFSNESVMQDAFNQINAEYTRRNPNVTVEVVQVPGGDFNVKVDTTILSGEQLDITYFNNMTLYAPRAMQGEFYPLDDLLAEDG